MADKIVKTEQEWQAILTPEQYAICRRGETERPFTGAYYHCKDEGLYRCVACGNALFISDTKYDSGSGWPSFYQPVSPESVSEKTDLSHGMRRIEVTCGCCDAHLGHVFPDGPPPTGTRYCINSIALTLEKTE